MAQAKKANKAKTTSTKKVEKVSIVEEPTPEVTSYLVPMFFKREPVEKDIHVADLFYHRTSHSFDFKAYAPNHEAHLEMIIAGDISINQASGQIKMISRAETPEAWIVGLSKAREFSGKPFIASDAQEIYEA
jgi:hypothetical protein|tara:strand:- start:79 stop:474 length:396 start_codon:yes stop_codon:yes gene_type:complete